MWLIKDFESKWTLFLFFHILAQIIIFLYTLMILNGIRKSKILVLNLQIDSLFYVISNTKTVTL